MNARLAPLILSMTLAVGCAGAGPSASTRPPAASLQASPSPTAAATGPRPLRMGNLAAGTYQTTRFQPTLLFTFADGWSPYFPDDADEVGLKGPGVDFYVVRPTQVRVPEQVTATTAPDDLLAWIVNHPRLKASDPTSVEVAGVSGSYVDIPQRDVDVTLFHFDSADLHVPPEGTGRLYVLPLDGADLVILALAPEGGSYEAAIAAAQPVVDSLAIAR